LQIVDWLRKGHNESTKNYSEELLLSSPKYILTNCIFYKLLAKLYLVFNKKRVWIKENEVNSFDKDILWSRNLQLRNRYVKGFEKNTYANQGEE